MKIVDNLDSPTPYSRPIAMAIGNFDGLHLGHQKILHEIKSYADHHHDETVAITFTNHPSNVLRPLQKVPQICTLDHKIKLLEEFGIDLLILLEFTKELSEHTAEHFLKKVRSSIPFSYLILGHDATLGKDRLGNRTHIEAMAKSSGFEVRYLDEQTIDGERISSTKIRQLIQQGELDHASKLLGREYSIYSKVAPGKKIGRKMGFPTANICVNGLCLPPLGVYAVHVIFNEQSYPGVANLGYAPTVRQDAVPTLEVFLFDHSIDLYEQSIEVIFAGYLRPEIKFDSVQALQEQIQDDVREAKMMLK